VKPAKHFAYQVIRSDRRKTVSIQVKNAQLRVLAPKWVANSEIEYFIQQKSQWIEKHISKQQNIEATSGLNWRSGEQLLFKGKFIELEIKSAAYHEIFLSTDNKLICASASELSTDAGQQSFCQQLLAWYNQQAITYIPNRVEQLARAYGFSYQEIKIRPYKSRWGSCNSKKKLTFNSLLMMAPIELIDYVIIHELCHLRYLNHSPSYWHLVEQFYPEHLSARHYFKELSKKLKNFGL
jgi:predicted metal-dependent hydrolase